MKEPKTTYSAEYIEERKQIDNLSRSVFNQMIQLNKRLTILQLTDFKFKISEPTELFELRITRWQRFLKWLRKHRIIK